VYPHFLLGDAIAGELGLVRGGRTTNDAMARLSVDALATALGGLQGRRVLVLGASYRENVKELAFSTAIPIVQELRRGGAHALIHDPLFEPHELKSLEAEVADLGSDIRVDAVIVQAFHSQYADLDWGRFHGLKVVFDGRGAADPDRIRKVGARYLAVGLPADTGAA
jgi:UDP-N-acetyl-D-mannosaminuronate dehydrogenase